MGCQRPVDRDQAGVEIAGALALVVLVRRWLRVSPSARTTARIVGAGLAALAIGLVCGGLLGALVGTLATVFVFAGLVLAFGLVTRDEIDALLGRS